MSFFKRTKKAKSGSVDVTVNPDEAAIHFTADGVTIYIPDYVDFDKEPPKSMPAHVRDAIVHLIALEHPEALDRMVGDLWKECKLLDGDEDTESAEIALAEINLAIAEPGEA